MSIIVPFPTPRILYLFLFGFAAICCGKHVTVSAIGEVIEEPDANLIPRIAIRPKKKWDIPGIQDKLTSDNGAGIHAMTTRTWPKIQVTDGSLPPRLDDNPETQEFAKLLSYANVFAGILGCPCSCEDKSKVESTLIPRWNTEHSTIATSPGCSGCTLTSSDLEKLAICGEEPPDRPQMGLSETVSKASAHDTGENLIREESTSRPDSKGFQGKRDSHLLRNDLRDSHLLRTHSGERKADLHVAEKNARLNDVQSPSSPEHSVRIQYAPSHVIFGKGNTVRHRHSQPNNATFWDKVSISKVVPGAVLSQESRFSVLSTADDSVARRNLDLPSRQTSMKRPGNLVRRLSRRNSLRGVISKRSEQEISTSKEICTVQNAGKMVEEFTMGIGWSLIFGLVSGDATSCVMELVKVGLINIAICQGPKVAVDFFHLAEKAVAQYRHKARKDQTLDPKEKLELDRLQESLAGTKKLLKSFKNLDLSEKLIQGERLLRPNPSSDDKSANKYVDTLLSGERSVLEDDFSDRKRDFGLETILEHLEFVFDEQINSIPSADSGKSDASNAVDGVESSKKSSGSSNSLSDGNELFNENLHTMGKMSSVGRDVSFGSGTSLDSSESGSSLASSIPGSSSGWNSSSNLGSDESSGNLSKTLCSSCKGCSIGQQSNAETNRNDSKRDPYRKDNMEVVRDIVHAVGQGQILFHGQDGLQRYCQCAAGLLGPASANPIRYGIARALADISYACVEKALQRMKPKLASKFCSMFNSVKKCFRSCH